MSEHPPKAGLPGVRTSASEAAVCWCGVETSRRHYPANDPENGPSHMPRTAAVDLSRVDFLALGAFMPLSNPKGEPLNGRARAEDLARRGLLVLVERDGRHNYYQITDAGRAAWEAHRDG